MIERLYGAGCRDLKSFVWGKIMKEKLSRKSRRLCIRPLAYEDFLSWKAWSTEMGPQKNIWDRKNKGLEEVTRKHFVGLLKSQKKLRTEDRFYDLGVFEKKTGELVGFVSIMDVIRGPAQSAFLGYSLGNRYWGRGYGKEAVLAAIDIGFRDLRLHRLEAGIEPTNKRSIFLARSIGLRKEGLKKRAVFLRGKWNDLVMYSATSEEFGIPWKGKFQLRPR